MLKRNNKERVIEEIKENKIKNVFNIIPNLADKVLDYNQLNFNIVDMIDNLFEDKRVYESDIKCSLFILAGIQSRMKQQFSISELSLALTSKQIIDKMNYNVVYDSKDSLLKEGNIRAWLGKYNQPNKEEIEFSNYFVDFFNQFTNKYLKKVKIVCNTHILDRSVLDVNLKNENY